MNVASLDDAASVRSTPVGGGVKTLVYGFFFLSGAVSLVYQVVWVRILSLFFGSDVYSAAATLSVFMGGLALGSWAASRLADRIRRPLLVYGICEIVTSLAALAVPYLLDALHGAYQQVYVNSFESHPWIYHSFRVLVAVIILLVPTTLMGATLPLLVRAFARRLSDLGRQVGILYSANTLGALFGTLVAGFVLLPALGVSTTVAVVVGVGLLVGVGSIIVGWTLELSPVEQTEAELVRGLPESPSVVSRGRILAVMTLSGMAALALEIVWMRILVQSFSATVYAFAIMLASFLFGIFYGSAKAGRFVDHNAEPIKLLGNLQFGLGFSVAILAVLTYVIPMFFGTLVWTLTGISGGAFGPASVVAQFIIASLLIVGPTMMLGATFPSAVRAVTNHISRRAEGTGSIYAANTAGAIFGSLIAAFVLLPGVGTRGSLLVIAVVFSLNGILLNARAVHGKQLALLSAGAAAGVAALLLPRQTIVNYNLQRSTAPEVIYHGDGVSNTVDIVKNDRGETIMMINGNVEADTSFIQRRHFILKAYLPLLLHPAPKDVAVVGLGLGITVSTTAKYPGVEKIRLIELSPDMVAAHRHLEVLTGGILRNPKVDLRIDDGRNFMAMSNERFDMITADPVHPRITGVGYLYTKEYYETIKARLRPDGVVTQWMPMYHISPASFDIAFRTFVEVFPNATFWYVRGHGLFVATQESRRISCKNLLTNFDNPAVKADFASIEINSPAEFLGLLLMDRKHIESYLDRARARQINTDNNALLEYKTPFEFLGRTDAIVPDLVTHAGWDDAEVFGEDCSPEIKDAARDALQRRLARILPELSETIR